MAGHRWPHAQIEVTVAKRDLGKKLQREKREREERRSCFLFCLPPLVLVLAVAELFASLLFPSIVVLSLSNHLLSSLVCWCSAFCHTTAACVSGKVHYAIPVPLLFVAMCTHQTVRQGHQQSNDGARSGWRRNARALRGDGQN